MNVRMDVCMEAYKAGCMFRMHVRMLVSLIGRDLQI